MEAVRVAILLAFSSTQRHVIGLQLADGIMRCGVLVDRKEDAAPLKLQKAGVGVSAIDWRCGLHADASSPFKSVKHFSPWSTGCACSSLRACVCLARCCSS
jgi:hypothetical protein